MVRRKASSTRDASIGSGRTRSHYRSKSQAGATRHQRFCRDLLICPRHKSYRVDGQVFIVLLARSAALERAQLEPCLLQVADNLADDIARDLTLLQTLATLPSFKSADWPAFYAHAKAALRGQAYVGTNYNNGPERLKSHGNLVRSAPGNRSLQLRGFVGV